MKELVLAYKQIRMTKRDVDKIMTRLAELKDIGDENFPVSMRSLQEIIMQECGYIMSPFSINEIFILSGNRIEDFVSGFTYAGAEQ